MQPTSQSDRDRLLFRLINAAALDADLLRSRFRDRVRSVRATADRMLADLDANRTPDPMNLHDTVLDLTVLLGALAELNRSRNHLERLADASPLPNDARD